MAYIEWSEKYSVKVPSLDEEHKRLFQMIDGFYSALKDGGHGEAMERLLEGLVEYVSVHFKHEEALMARSGFDGLAAQEAAHRAFAQKVLDVQKRFREGKLVLSYEITRFLKNWLTEHILQADTAYADSLVSAGIR